MIPSPVDRPWPFLGHSGECMPLNPPLAPFLVASSSAVARRGDDDTACNSTIGSEENPENSLKFSGNFSYDKNLVLGLDKACEHILVGDTPGQEVMEGITNLSQGPENASLFSGTVGNMAGTLRGSTPASTLSPGHQPQPFPSMSSEVSRLSADHCL